MGSAAPGVSWRAQGRAGQDSTVRLPGRVRCTGNGRDVCQCRTVKISILGDEGVPVQVDGEAWVQPPGYIRIVHKNRAQMLTRDRVRGLPEGWGSPANTPALLL